MLKTLATASMAVLALMNSSSAQTVTGCLDREGGLSRIDVGNAPAKPCGRNATQVTLGTPGRNLTPLNDSTASAYDYNCPFRHLP